MLYTQYPYFIKRSVFVELPTMDFLEMLVRERHVPAVCKTALEEFRAGKQPLVSGGALIWANRAESVARARWKSTIPSPFRRIRKVIKWVMPYAVVRIVQKIQDRVRFGKPA